MNAGDLARRALYESVRKRTTMTFEEFSEATSRFLIVPVQDDGEVIGAVMVDANEIHVGVCRRPRGPHRGQLRQIMGPLIARYGSVRTGVAFDNQLGLGFCKRLGFVETHRDERGVYLECKEMLYV